MKNKTDIINFIIIILKCFLILLLFGEALPKTIDYVLYYIYRSNNYGANATFVCYIVNKNISFINNFIFIFKVFIL